MEENTEETDGEQRDEAPVGVGDLICGGRFELVSRLAEGGTAVTYVALDLLLKETVAAKIARGADEVDKQLFLTQFWKIAKLSSPHVAALLGYFEVARGDARYPVLILELVRGIPLGKFLAAESELRCLEVCRLLAFALDAVAESGMRHGDLTGDNVLVRAGRPVLIDPDSAGRDSGRRSGPNEFYDFVSILGKSRIGVSFPAVLVALSKLDPAARPFRAATEILRHERPEVLLQSPGDRLKGLGAVYRKKSADRSSRFSTLVEDRRKVYRQLAEQAAVDCTEVGLTIEASEGDEHERAKQEELSCLSSVDGLASLKSSVRRYVAAGRTWELQLRAHNGFAIPSPFSEAHVFGEVVSLVCDHEAEPLLQERLRFRRSGERGPPGIELEIGDTWIILPGDWRLRILEVLVGERVSAFATPQLIAGKKENPDRLGNQRRIMDGDYVPNSAGGYETVSGIASLRQMVQTSLSHERGTWAGDPQAGTRLLEIARIPRSKWREHLDTVAKEEFLEAWRQYFVSLERYDVLSIDGRWYLEVAGQLATSTTTRIVWQFPLTRLDDHAAEGQN